MMWKSMERIFPPPESDKESKERKEDFDKKKKERMIGFGMKED